MNLAVIIGPKILAIRNVPPEQEFVFPRKLFRTYADKNVWCGKNCEGSATPYTTDVIKNSLSEWKKVAEQKARIKTNVEICRERLIPHHATDCPNL